MQMLPIPKPMLDDRPSGTEGLHRGGGLWNNSTALFLAIFLIVGVMSLLSLWGLGPLPVVARWFFPFVQLEPMAPRLRSRVDATPTVPLLQSEIDLLRVTSISLGKAPLAVICGREVGEGEFFRLKTARGTFPVRVEAIYDGSVRISHGSEIILAKLRPLAPPPRHPTK